MELFSDKKLDLPEACFTAVSKRRIISNEITLTVAVIVARFSCLPSELLLVRCVVVKQPLDCCCLIELGDDDDRCFVVQLVKSSSLLLNSILAFKCILIFSSHS